MLAQILLILLPIGGIVLAGIVYGRLKKPDMGSVNQLNMDVFLPVLVFHMTSQPSFHILESGPMLLGGVAVTLLPGLLLIPVVRWLRADWRTFLPPMMFGNSGNLGLPLAALALGAAALPDAIALFTVQAVLQIVLSEVFFNRRGLGWHMLRLPFLVAAFLGLLVNLIGWKLPAAVDQPLMMMGMASIPMLLISLGVRAANLKIVDGRIGVAGAFLRPLSGLVAYAAIVPFLNLSAAQAGTLLVFAVLPSALLSYVYSEKYNQQPETVGSIVCLSHVLGLLTMPLAFWYLTK